jgi:hypothetical protein
MYEFRSPQTPDLFISKGDWVDWWSSKRIANGSATASGKDLAK